MGIRDIIFRGKRTDNGEWFEGCLATFKDGDCAIFDPDDEETPLYQVDPETVGQYTGLTDKSGKKIFEGDIVQYYDTIEGNICIPEIVIFGDSGWQTKSIKCDVADELNPRVAKDYKVIGNIYDNPKLLK